VTVFVDRRRLLTLARDDARDAGAAAGAAFTAEVAGALREAWRRDQALRGAVRLLAARQRSRRGLIDALRAKGHTAPAAEAAAAEMDRRGALDEEAFAASAARAAAKRPVGRSYVESSLARKGVPRELASRAAGEALAGRDALADATTLAERALRSMPAGLERQAVVRRLSGRLARRGFAADIVRGAVRTAMQRAGRDRR
jgi:regulatory protein